MAWVTIPNNSYWEYDNAPADPGVGSPYRDLWLKQTAGIRTNSDGSQVYTKCRIIGTTVGTAGEISKSYWDAQT
jgi:hypothetical protein